MVKCVLEHNWVLETFPTPLMMPLWYAELLPTVPEQGLNNSNITYWWRQGCLILVLTQSTCLPQNTCRISLRTYNWWGMTEMTQHYSIMLIYQKCTLFWFSVNLIYILKLNMDGNLYFTGILLINLIRWMHDY